MMYPPIHERKPFSFSFKRLDMLWERYPQFHERTTFSTLDALLEEHHRLMFGKAAPHMKAFGPTVRDMRTSSTFHVLEAVRR